MKSRWVHHKGKRIFIADFSNLEADAAAIKGETQAIKDVLKLERPGSVRSITFVQGTFGNPEVIQALGELLPFSNKYVYLRALVGVSGFRKHFIDTMTGLVGNVHFRQFDTLEQALDWMAED